jgi:hypothetical protein
MSTDNTPNRYLSQVNNLVWDCQLPKSTREPQFDNLFTRRQLILGPMENLYGTTSSGGAAGYGVLLVLF